MYVDSCECNDLCERCGKCSSCSESCIDEDGNEYSFNKGVIMEDRLSVDDRVWFDKKIECKVGKGRDVWWLLEMKDGKKFVMKEVDKWYFE